MGLLLKIRLRKDLAGHGSTFYKHGVTLCVCLSVCLYVPTVVMF